MRLSAIDSLQHGLLNLRANWQLILLQALQSLLVMAISAVGLVPIFLVLGFKFVRGAVGRFGGGGEAELLESVLGAGAPLLVAFLVSTLIWTVAFVVYCYMQGGILGVLAAGERRAAGSQIRWSDFRTFSARAFFEQAERLTWPVFWLVNLFLVLGMLVLLVFLVFVAVLLTAVVGEGFSAEGFESLGQLGASIVLFGCLGFALLLVFSVFFSLWMQVALGELAAGTRGTFAAARAGLVIVGRRLPGLLLLFLLLVVASIAMAIVVTPLSLVMNATLGDRTSSYFVGQAFLTLLQWFITGIVNLGWAGTIIALVLGEREGAA
ncbi:MAG: hypothetical protein ACE5GX_05625 [Thermoanaerobaculia bacterium]